jgi:DNA-binding transcriptional LysR family regulator
MQGANVAGNIRVGCPQDFAPILPSVLSHFSSLYPRMQIELRIEGNAALADAIGMSQIDLAIVIGHEDRATAQTIGHLDLVWIASSSFARQQNQPLPLAALGPQCAFRKRAIEQLEAKKILYRIAANSPSLDGLWGCAAGWPGHHSAHRAEHSSRPHIVWLALRPARTRTIACHPSSECTLQQ